MKKKHFIYSIFLSVLITSCNQDDKKLMINPIQAKVSAQIGEMTRATNQQWDDGDKIGIYASSDEESFDNVPYLYHNTFSGTDDQSVYFNHEDQEMNLSAYYPYTPSSEIHDGVINIKTCKSSYGSNFTVNRNYMFAHSVTATSSAPDVNFHFEHKMVKLDIAVSPASNGSMSDLYQTLRRNFCYLNGLKQEGTFNIKTGELAVNNQSGTYRDVIIDAHPVREDDAVHFTLYLIPQTISRVIFAVALDGTHLNSAYLVVPADENGERKLLGGHEYECKIVADPSHESMRETLIKLNIGINDWVPHQGRVERKY